MGLLVGTVVQGSADAFKEEMAATALTGQTKRAYRIDAILIEWPTVLNIDNQVSLELSITRRSKAAMPRISDIDVIYKAKIIGDIVTSGGALTSGIVTFEPDGDLLIVEDPIYIQVDSNATALANTFSWQIRYTDKTISEVDRLTLLTQSLS